MKNELNKLNKVVENLVSLGYDGDDCEHFEGVVDKVKVRLLVEPDMCVHGLNKRSKELLDKHYDEIRHELFPNWV